MDLSRKTTNTFLHKCLNRDIQQEGSKETCESVPTYSSFNNIFTAANSNSHCNETSVNNFFNCQMQSYLKSIEYSAMLCNPVMLNYIMTYHKLLNESQQSSNNFMMLDRSMRQIDSSNTLTKEYLPQSVAYQKSRIQQLYKQNLQQASVLSPERLNQLSPATSGNFSPLLTPRSTVSRDFNFYSPSLAANNNFLEARKSIPKGPVPQDQSSLKVIELSRKKEMSRQGLAKKLLSISRTSASSARLPTTTSSSSTGTSR